MLGFGIPMFLAEVVSFHSCKTSTHVSPMRAFPICTLTFCDFNALKMLKIIGYCLKFNLIHDRYYQSKLLDLLDLPPVRGTIASCSCRISEFLQSYNHSVV